MSPITRVTILDGHPDIVDTYLHRLAKVPEIRVVATIAFGAQLEPALKRFPSEVLLLDVDVPVGSQESVASFSVLRMLPGLLETFPRLEVLVISMTAERGLIRAALEAGASGYLLKDDRASMRLLGSLVLAVAAGAYRFSPRAQQLLLRHAVTTGGLLTGDQIHALACCAAFPDYSIVEMARQLNLTNAVTRHLLTQACLSLGVQDRATAVARALELGLIPRAPGQERG